MGLRFGVDTGGTFTDIVAFDDAGSLSVRKIASTPADPSAAIVGGLHHRRDDAVALLVHGTTVATNTVLQRSGAVAALITTRGFRDVLHIQRQDRPQLYDFRAQRAAPLIPRELRLELTERMLFDGSVRTPVALIELPQLIASLREAQVVAVAVAFLHSYANPAHELQVGEVLAGELPGVTVCLSHQLVGACGEYERFSTCAMNAYVQPVMQHYLGRLSSRLQDEGVKAPLFIMKSNGGVTAPEVAGEKCVETILSGPAGGVAAGVAIARTHDNRNLITADMGGTSFDVSVITAGAATFARDSEIGGLAIAVPMLDIHTIGAGGGSIGWLDAGGALRIGPQSAGAVPGPACYGRGGSLPTVTDANLVLGRLGASSRLGGSLALDLEAARGAIREHLAAPSGLTVEAAAEGMLRVVNSAIVAAIRKLTVERGLDPRDYTLCPFGGAGPLHGAELAAELGVRDVLIPAVPGVTSALGLLLSKLREDRLRTFVVKLSPAVLPEVAARLAELAADAAAALAFANAEVRIQRRLGLRYVGQSYELSVPLADGDLHLDTIGADFAAEHRRQYGYDRPEEDVELNSLWVAAEVTLQDIAMPAATTASGQAAPIAERQVWFGGRPHPTPIYRRDAFAPGRRLTGPAIIEQLDTTIAIAPAQQLRVDAHGQLILSTERGDDN